MSEKTWKYRDAKKLTQWVVWLIYAQIVISVVAVGSGLLEWTVLNGMSEGAYASQELMMKAAESSDLRQAVVAVAQLLTFLISGIVILVWIHRANANARALGGSNMKFTPGWAVGWYFVPFANLWKPYQAMREIVNASVDPDGWSDKTTPTVVSLWWTVWIGSGLLSNAAMRASFRAEDLEATLRASVLTLGSDAAGIVQSVVTLLLVWHVARVQQSRAAPASA